MNEFTKEELTILFLELNIAIRNWGGEKEFNDYSNLKDKIQSMIDNYCEHEWSCWDDEHNTRVCTKCNETRTGEI